MAAKRSTFTYRQPNRPDASKPINPCYHGTYLELTVPLSDGKVDARLANLRNKMDVRVPYASGQDQVEARMMALAPTLAEHLKHAIMHTCSLCTSHDQIPEWVHKAEETLMKVWMGD